MLKTLLIAFITLFSTYALAETAEPFTGDCQKVAELESNRRTEVLVCEVSRGKFCLATNIGGIDCSLIGRYQYNARDHRRFDVCRKVSDLSFTDDPFSAGYEFIEFCSIGRGRNAVECYVSTTGDISCI